MVRSRPLSPTSSRLLDCLVIARLGAVAGLALASIAAGCDAAPPAAAGPSAPGALRADRALLTSAAASHLNARGQFEIASHVAVPGEITEAQAITLARIVARDFLPYLGEVLSRDRGATVDVPHLTACGRVFYAASPYETPDAAIPPAARRRYGPWYLVALCGADGVQQVSIAISAYNQELQVVNDSIVRPSVAGGNEWFALAVSDESGGGLPLSPEVAATLAANTSGRLVAGVPELIAPVAARAIPPQFARWKIPLDSIASFSDSSGRVRTADTVFAAISALRKQPTLLLPSIDQPRATASRAFTARREHVSDPIASILVEVRRLTAYPLDFESAYRAPQNGGRP